MRGRRGNTLIYCASMLEQNIERIPLSGCWIWMGPVTEKGYGRAYIGMFGGWRGAQMRAHRLSWLIYKGLVPRGLQVCHHCDVPECVNPAHLFLGTAQDNTLDMFKKGRARPGGKQCKLKCA